MSSSFGLQTISFAFFGAVFVGASAAASIFIVPLLILSFIFSGLVVVFSGLSYTTFKLASSKYNRTVLLLNRLLRKLADTIPPSVGLQEVPKDTKPTNGILPSLALSDKIGSIQTKINGFFKPRDKDVKGKESNDQQQGPDPETFQIKHGPSLINPNDPVVYDDRFDNTNDDLDEDDQAVLPLLNGDSKSTDTPNPSLIDQAVKDGEIDNNH